MSSRAGMCVCVGGLGLRAPGWLAMHSGEDADIPWRPGHEFPFEDRAVDVMACSDVAAMIPREDCVRFMLECRRTLKPRGLLSLGSAMANGPTGGCLPEDIARAAGLIGLESTDVAPVMEHCRVTLERLYTATERRATAEYTKRDRTAVGDPLVSIVIPAYSSRFFAASLDSALAQSYANIEIVVSDDSGAPEIEALTRARAGRRRVRYLRNEVRLGGRGNFTRCLESAQGEFVKFLCDDDLLAPTCVALLLDAFRQAPDITLATSRRRRIDEYGVPLGDQPATQPIVATDTTIAGYTLANALLMAGLNTVGEPSTVLFRKADLLDQAPDYFRFNGVRGLGIIDLVTWSALLLKGDAVYLSQSLSAFRIHAAQRQRNPEVAQRSIASIRALQGAWLELGLSELVPPHLILAKPFPAPADADWQLQRPLCPVVVRATEPTRSVEHS